MTAKKSNGADVGAKTAPGSLTPGESKILSLAWQCMITQPTVGTFASLYTTCFR